MELHEKMSIEVALATYNGSFYLGDLLTSLIKQTKFIDRIIVRDDNSSDNTILMLLSYKDKGLPITILPSNNKRLGILANFSLVLQHTSANYVFLCDQDDIWFPEKVEILIKKMTYLEQMYGKDTPLLVFSDMKIVNQELAILSHSGMKYQGFHPDKFNTFKKALLQNIVPGCSMVVNQSLLKLALPIPKEAIMHDWWIVLVASAFGKIVYVNKSLFYYRQHPNNNVGAISWNIASIMSKIANFKVETKLISEGFKEALMQAKKFYDIYSAVLPKRHKSELEELLNIPNKTYFSKYLSSIKLGLRKEGILRTLGFYVSLSSIGE
jgi:glycosyltransferase involved in cell wall biosynthesis